MMTTESVVSEIEPLLDRLDEKARRFIEAYDGANTKEALSAAGLQPKAFRMRMLRNEHFRRLVTMLDDARKAVVANAVASNLAPEAEPLVNELKAIALGPAQGSKGLDAKLRAIAISLRILGIATDSPSPSVQVNVGGDHRSISVLAAELWNGARNQGDQDLAT